MPGPGHRDRYEQARLLARGRRREEMLVALAEAIREGIDDRHDYAAAARRDPDLRVFAQDPAFLALTDPVPADPAALLGCMRRRRGTPAPTEPPERYQALAAVLRGRIRRELAAGRRSEVFRRFDAR